MFEASKYHSGTDFETVSIHSRLVEKWMDPGYPEKPKEGRAITKKKSNVSVRIVAVVVVLIRPTRAGQVGPGPAPPVVNPCLDSDLVLISSREKLEGANRWKPQKKCAQVKMLKVQMSLAASKKFATSIPLALVKV
uniref:Transposase n=1 Tax=Panagrellus redivivus TaxID=6233 RepID=A0A7E4VBX1_PANRE